MSEVLPTPGADQSNPRPLVIEVVDWEMAAVLRSKTPAERLGIAWGLWEFARNTLRRRIAAEHPDWTKVQVHRAAAQRMLHDS